MTGMPCAKGLSPGELSGVIFDCDGVMIDSRAANRLFYNRVLAAFGLGPMTPAQEEFAFMSTAMQALERMIPHENPAKIEAVISSTINYQRDIMPLIRLMPGFAGLIAFLREHGLPMAVATNRVREGMQRVLDFFRLPPYFNPIVTASDVSPKPSPAGALHIVASWGVNADQVLFVGDSIDDMRSAFGAGTAFCAFNSSDITPASARRLLVGERCRPNWFSVRDHFELMNRLMPLIGAPTQAKTHTSREEE